MRDDLSLHIGIDTDINLSDVFGKHIAILGSSGGGKSNSAAVLMEELLTHRIPLCVIDIAGEYWSLKEKFPVIVTGKSEQVDLPAESYHAAALAEYSVMGKAPVVLDISGFGNDDFSYNDRFDFVKNFLGRVWQLKQPIDMRSPYFVFIEEAHNFVPQSTSTPVSDMLIRFAKEGRKTGINLVVMTQRSTGVDKDVLTQMKMRIMHAVHFPNDVKVYEQLISQPMKWTRETVPNLLPGQAVLVFNKQSSVIQVRRRETFDAGFTPGLDAIEAPTIHTDDTAIAALAGLLDSIDEPERVDPVIEKLEKQLAQAEDEKVRLLDEIEQLQAKNERLEIENSIFSKFEIVVSQAPVEQPVSPAPQKKSRRQVSDVRPQATSLRSTIQDKQESRFKVFLQDIGAMKAYVRKSCHYLLLRPDDEYALSKLAQRIGLAKSTLTKNPPKIAVEYGILKRRHHRGEYFYQSNLDAVLQKYNTLTDARTRIIRALET